MKIGLGRGRLRLHQLGAQYARCLSQAASTVGLAALAMFFRVLVRVHARSRLGIPTDRQQLYSCRGFPRVGRPLRVFLSERAG